MHSLGGGLNYLAVQVVKQVEGDDPWDSLLVSWDVAEGEEKSEASAGLDRSTSRGRADPRPPSSSPDPTHARISSISLARAHRRRFAGARGRTPAPRASKS